MLHDRRAPLGVAGSENMRRTLPLTLLVLASLSSLASDPPPSQPVAEAESAYADLNDANSIISTIESGLFTTYLGKDKSAWQQVYQEKRKLIVEKLGNVPASGLSES